MNTALKYPPFPDDPDSGPPSPPRKKHRWWHIIGWSLLGIFTFIVLAALLLASLVNTDGEHRAIMNYAQKEASKALGVQVHLQNLLVHWYPLGVDIDGIRVESAGPHSNPPLLQINHVAVGVQIVSLLQAKWYLSSLRIDHPVAWIYVDKNGVSNIPSFGSSKSSGNSNEIFNLGIRHAILDGGEVFYNSRPSALAADLYHLDLRAAYDAPQQMYSGTVSYSDGRLKYGAYQPIPHSLDASFSLTPATFRLKQATLSSGDSQVVLTALVQNYETNPAAQAQYRIALDGAQFARLLRDPSIPAGFLRASGSLQYQKRPNLPPLQSVSLSGNLASDRLDVSTASAHAAITNLIAHYSLHHGNAALRDLHAGILGGEITAQGTMTNLGGNSHSSFNAALKNISLAQLKQEAGNAAATPGVALAGTLNATASATWGKTLADLVARADANIRAQVAARHGTGTANSHSHRVPSPNSPTNSVSIPLQSEIHATYTRSNAQLALIKSYIRTTQTDLTLNGTISRRSSLAIHLQANDLSELASIVNSFSRPASGRQPLALAGAASFVGNVQGSLDAPHITGELVAKNLHVNGSDWKLVRTGINGSPDHASLENAILEPAPRGHIALNASAALHKWAFSKQSPFQVRVTASQVDIADLMKIAGKQFPVSGTLRTSINLHGSVMNPEGSGDIDLTDVSAYQQPVNSITLNFSGNDARAQANLSLQTPAGSIRGNFTVQPRQRTYTAQVSTSGIHLNKIAVIKTHNIAADGVLVLKASGQGSFDNPELQATLESPSLTVSKQTISALKLQLNVANHVANAALSSTAFDAPIQAKATVHLTGDYLADASLNTPVFSLRPIVALYSPEQAGGISGQTQIQATLHGPLKDMKQLDAHVTIPVFKVGYQNKIQLAAPAPIQVDYRDGVVDVPQGSIEGTDTNLQFQGHIPTAGNQPMSLRLQGAIDLKLAQLFDPSITSSGQVKLNINSNGVVTNGADLGGEVDIVNANFADPTMPVGLQNGNGVLKLTANRLNISNFEGRVGGGKVTMQGSVQYRPHLLFALGMAAKDIRMLYPQGMRESIDANIRLDGAPTNAVLGGTVGLTNLSFTPAFNLTSIAGQLSGGVAVPPSQGFTQDLKLNLAAHSTSNMNLVSRELSVDGSANLQIRGTAAEPVILGRINLTGGDILLDGNRFVMTGGTIQFVNPMQTEPVLNLSITTTIQQYKIDLRFQGPAAQMRPSYSSDPSLPQADIIHLLAFGSTTEASANNPTPANQEAESLVASQVSSQVTSRISRVAGISQLSISPVLEGGTAEGPAGADITIRQRVTSNLFVTFSTNVAATQDEVIQGQYQISPHVSISATRDENGGFGVDALIKKSW